MANGWAPDGAVQDQIDDTVTDAVLRARANLPKGESETHCIECGEEIPEAPGRFSRVLRNASRASRCTTSVRSTLGSIAGAAKTAS